MFDPARPCTILASGEYFYYDDPHGSKFTINDIARSLSHICRYFGHLPKFYSVAEHSILVSEMLPEELQLEGLLHDATEAFVGDMIRPLKKILPDFEEIEYSVYEAIAARFGLQCPLPSLVKMADSTMLRTEQVHLLKNNDPWLNDVMPRTLKFSLWSPEVAEKRFLGRFHQLYNRRR